MTIIRGIIRASGTRVGWAQICGGKLIAPQEKHALDEWYIRLATLWLDAAIVLRTISTLSTCDRRDEKAISGALVEKVQGEMVNVSDTITSSVKKEQQRGFIKHAEAARLVQASGSYDSAVHGGTKVH